ncbi:MAG: hypothetical protein HQL78_13315 [Magnetococcales bacterium]|nr:hypothetical protein [Magnetococcales bacterium]
MERKANQSVVDLLFILLFEILLIIYIENYENYWVFHIYTRVRDYFNMDDGTVGILGVCFFFIIYGARRAKEGKKFSESLFNINNELKEQIIYREKMEKILLRKQRLESIGTLSSGIAHDFNNILYAISSFNEMNIQALPEGSDEWDNSMEIQKSVNRATELIKQILIYSKGIEGDMKLIDIGDILLNVIAMFKQTTNPNIKIIDKIQLPIYIVADPTQMHQVFLNLFSNSVYAMKSTGGELKVVLEKVNSQDLFEILDNCKTNEYAKITVSDTGTGISEGVLNKIFDPFFTTKKVGEGTGLGLSVVYGIIKKHDGEIFVDSEEGKSTSFSIYLPIKKEN